MSERAKVKLADELRRDLFAVEHALWHKPVYWQTYQVLLSMQLQGGRGVN